jgi:PAS domain-containing protein
MIDGQVLAVLVFFMAQVKAKDIEQVELFEAIANPLGMVLRLKQAETALMINQQRINRLMDTLPGIVYTTTGPPHWQMRSLSRGCEALTGYTREELTQTDGTFDYNKITHPADLPEVLATIEAAVSQQTTYEVEYRILTRQGQENGSGKRGMWLWMKRKPPLDWRGLSPKSHL